MKSSKLTPTEIEELKTFVLYEANAPSWLQSFAETEWSSIIPYTTRNGDESTMDEWCGENVNMIVEHFADELKGSV